MSSWQVDPVGTPAGRGLQGHPGGRGKWPGSVPEGGAPGGFSPWGGPGAPGGSTLIAGPRHDKSKIPSCPLWLTEGGLNDDHTGAKTREALQRGADPNAPDENGNRPLPCAAMIGNLAVVEALLAAGANPLLPG